ncbi:MAG: nitroreductase family protein [Candidatus Dependentiae bacterium]|nr:nitroreductase family protein [Candidatus Dependentiae bacterium]
MYPKIFAFGAACFVLVGAAITTCKHLQDSQLRADTRKPAHKVADCIINRWSPRAMSGQPMTDEELNSLFEAARWAPSSYNDQPWFFLYAKRDSQHWQTYFDLLVDFNKEWAKKASVLVVVISRNNFTHNNAPSRTHSFDTGAAWQNMALQASMNGFVARGMGGFDYDRAKTALQISDDYTVEAMIALGKPGNKEDLPQYMQEQETPSTRKKVEEFSIEGTFGK